MFPKETHWDGWSRNQGPEWWMVGRAGSTLHMTKIVSASNLAISGSGAHDVVSHNLRSTICKGSLALNKIIGLEVDGFTFLQIPFQHVSQIMKTTKIKVAQTVARWVSFIIFMKNSHKTFYKTIQETFEDPLHNFNVMPDLLWIFSF